MGTQRRAVSRAWRLMVTFLVLWVSLAGCEYDWQGLATSVAKGAINAIASDSASGSSGDQVVPSGNVTPSETDGTTGASKDD